VNNAGVDTLTGPLATVDYFTKLARLWEVDVVATIRLSRLIGEFMHKAGRGSIINIGWDQVEWGMEGDSGEIFCATKGAVMAFTRSLAKTLSPIVRVNCIAPDWQTRAVGESLLRRWGTAQDVAEAALFLASPGSAFITGQSIAVNGGRR
jgi:3-oxoacyl-[acyl-carrier protein] reductase